MTEEDVVNEVENMQRRAQIRELQHELRRAGYFHGTIDGIWSDSTREALDRFREDYT